MTHGQVPASQSSSGFTVVEVVVAFVLFSIVAIMLVSITEFVQYSQRQSLYTNIANQAAQSKIAEYQNMGYSAHSDGDSEEFAGDDSLKGLPAGSTAVIEVSESSLSDSSKELKVTITYPAASSDKIIKMKAYVSESDGAWMI